MLGMTIPEARAIVERLRGKSPAVAAAVMNRLNALLVEFQKYVVNEKLSGQLLHRRSGALARSVVVIPAEIKGTEITGGVTAGAAPAFYAKFFELPEVGGAAPVKGGGMWAVNAVKKRALAFMVGGEKVFAKYVFHPPLAARPFLSQSAEESLPMIREQLQAAIDEELAK